MREFTHNPSKTIVFTGGISSKPTQIFHDASGKKRQLFYRNLILISLVIASILAILFPFIAQSFALSKSIEKLKQTTITAPASPHEDLFAMAPESSYYNTFVQNEAQNFGTVFVSTHKITQINGSLEVEALTLSVIQNQLFEQSQKKVIVITVDPEIRSTQFSPQFEVEFTQKISQISAQSDGVLISILASQIVGDGYNNYFSLLTSVRAALHKNTKLLYGHRALDTQYSNQLIKDESKNVDRYVVSIASENSGLPIIYTPELKKLITEPGSAPYWIEFRTGEFSSGLELPVVSTPVSYRLESAHNYDVVTGVAITQSPNKLITTARYDNPAISNQVSLYKDLVIGASKRGVSNISLVEQGVSDILLDRADKMALETLYPQSIFQKNGVGKLLQISKESQLGKRNIQKNQNSIVSTSISVAPFPTIIEAHGIVPGSIALTFDDGPDPEWTPKILDILAQYNIKATFFVIGEQVQLYPDIARRIVAEGHTIGNHTFTHPHNMNELTVDQIRQEILTAEAAIKHATNVHTTLFRTPNSVSDALDESSDPKIIQIVSTLGYTLASYDIDTFDWKKPGADQILQNIQESITDNSSQILMHDGGGDRKETLAALPKILNYLQDRQLAPVTLESLVDTKYNTAVVPWISHAQYAMLHNILPVSSPFFRIFLAGTVAIGFVRYAMIIVGLRKYCANRKRFTRPYQNYDPLVTILIPAYNESATILATIQSLQASSYRRLQLVIIDDQSSDDTYEKVKKIAKKYRNIVVLTQKNGGKSVALNYGLSFAKGKYTINIDADTLFNRLAIAKLVTHFLDPKVMGVAGTVHVGNYFVNMLTQAQNIEYTFSQFIDKIAFNSFNAVSVVPGAIGAWRTEHLRKLGGYECDNYAEDTDLTVRTLAKGGIVRFEPEALSYTEAPQDTLSFFKQRLRWQYGTMQVLIKHRRLLFSPRHSVLGMVALPLLGINLLFVLIAPITNIFALTLVFQWLAHIIFPSAFAFSILQTHHAALLGIVALGYAMVEVFLTLYAIYLTRGAVKYRSILWLPVVLIWYRLYIWWITMISIMKILQGMTPNWGIQKRHGSVTQPLQLAHNPSLLLTTTPK